MKRGWQTSPALYTARGLDRAVRSPAFRRLFHRIPAKAGTTNTDHFFPRAVHRAGRLSLPPRSEGRKTPSLTLTARQSSATAASFPRRYDDAEEQRLAVQLAAAVVGDPLLRFLATEELGQLRGRLDPGLRET